MPRKQKSFKINEYGISIRFCRPFSKKGVINVPQDEKGSVLFIYIMISIRKILDISLISRCWEDRKTGMGIKNYNELLQYSITSITYYYFISFQLMTRKTRHISFLLP